MQEGIEHISIAVPKGWAAEIKDFAESRGETLEDFCIGAIANRMQALGFGSAKDGAEE